jgi:exodeoxyribonuclease V alpha subunit
MREALCGGAAECMDGRYRLGEKLITTRGQAELGIANGTTFVVAGDEPDEGELLLETETGGIMPMPYRHAGILRGGFCASVHKAQGMEIPAVIVCLHSSHNPLLASRNLLYTAITRAQRFCVLAGDDRAISRALANTDAMRRHSGLGEWLMGSQ